MKWETDLSVASAETLPRSCLTHWLCMLQVDAAMSWLRGLTLAAILLSTYARCATISATLPLASLYLVYTASFLIEFTLEAKAYRPQELLQSEAYLWDLS